MMEKPCMQQELDAGECLGVVGAGHGEAACAAGAECLGAATAKSQ